MQHKNFLIYAAAAFMLLSPSLAHAGAAPVPQSAEPGRAEQQITPLTAPQKAKDAGTVTSNENLKAPKGADNVKFKLVDVTIDGGSVYSDEQVAQLYKDKVGETVTLADVYGIANRLTAKYRNDGYILSQVVVPPQTIDSGRIKLRVVEGFVNDIRIEGNTNGRLRDLQPYLNKIKAAQPFSSKVLERYILLINDLPGITAKSVLSPSKVAGATDITIVVSRKPFDLFAQIDNRGTRYLGPMQVNTGVRFNNPFGTYEGVNFQYAAAPMSNELHYFSGSLTEPIGHEGTTLTLGGSVTKTSPGFTLAAFDVSGLARRGFVAVDHPFLRSRNENLRGGARLEHVNSQRTDNATVGEIRDILSVLRFNANYQLIDSLAGANTVTAEVSRGLDIMGSTDETHVNTTRPGAEDEFTKGTLEISRLQRITNYFDVFASATGQLSSHRLLTSEQFGLGGSRYGSAYDSSEITGDDGIAARAELRLNDPFSINSDTTTQFYTYYDIGKVWDPGNAVVADRTADLASAGGGLRLSLNENISGSVELAIPITRNVATQNGRQARLFGALTGRF